MLILAFFLLTASNAEGVMEPPAQDFCQDFVFPNCTWKGPEYFNINSSKPCLFNCTFDLSLNKAVRISAHIRSNPLNSPVFFSVRQEHVLSSWTLPRFFSSQGDNQPFSSLEQILCPSKKQKSEKMFFRIETNVDFNVTLNFTLQQISYLIQLDEIVKIKSTPVSPWYKLYKWDEHISSVLVGAQSVGKSGHSVCTYLSIQDGKCPVGNTASDILSSSGKYLSFSEKGTLVADKHQFPNGVFVVVLPLPDDGECTGIYLADGNRTSRWKTTQIEITKHLSISDAWEVYLAASVILGLVTVGVVFGINIYISRHYAALENTDDDISLTSNEDQIEGRGGPSATSLLLAGGIVNDTDLRIESGDEDEIDIQSVPEEHFNFNRTKKLNEETRAITQAAGPSSNLQDEPTTDGTLNTFQDREEPFPKITPSVNPRYLNWWILRLEYENKDSKALVTETGFYNVIWISALFITLPFLDILRSYLTDLLYKGWEDKCYFNMECAISFGIFTDFSAIFTNIMYIVLGLAFSFIFYKHQKLSSAVSNIKKVGVNRNNGLLWALGLGLIIQGIMSSIYHTCPNKVTLRFDMMYMYIITLTVVVSVWGFRHSSVQHHVYSSVGLVGVVLLVAEVQNWVSPSVFWIIFIIIHSLLTASTGFSLYKSGSWSFSPKAFWTILKEWEQLTRSPELLEENMNDKLNPKKLAKVTLGIIANVVIMVVGCSINMKSNKYILAICLVNLAMYMVNYLVSKLAHGEKGTKIAWLSFAMGLICWIVALVFFANPINDSEGTPSSSRSLNSGCILAGVFDVHDLWHIFSAFGMFFSFVGILTIDDDLSLRSVKKIPVF